MLERGKKKRDKENKRKTEGEEEKKGKSERKEEVSELVSLGYFYNKYFNKKQQQCTIRSLVALRLESL